MRRSEGFTLIELLVVIAIIAILAAILFPVFATARARARQASCLSNVKQLALGVLMYADDYDETMPQRYRRAGPDGMPCWPQAYIPDYHGAVTNLQLLNWIDGIYPYIKNQQLYICPTFGQTVYEGCQRPHAGIVVNNCAFSEFEPYCNVWGGMYQGPGVPCNRVLGQFVNPAGSVMLGDGGCNYICHADDYSDPLDSSMQTLWPYMYEQVRRHNGGGNYGFMDGHAKWMKPDGLSESLFRCEGIAKKWVRS